MKFPHNSLYNNKFSEIKGIRFYPYVGVRFPYETKRIMIFAHNRYHKPETFDSEQMRTSSKTHYADAMEEFTYEHAKYTKAFRSFIKASLSLTEDYNENSNFLIIKKIDDFVEKISHTNYINDYVSSSKALNVIPDKDLVHKSNAINMEILNILEITHIVSWGKNVFDYILLLPEVTLIERWSDFEKIKGLSRRTGFEYAKISVEGHEINLLKVFHPSMPGFGHYNIKTQGILNWFYNL